MERTNSRSRRNRNKKQQFRDEFIRGEQKVERYNMSQNTFIKIALEERDFYKLRGVNLVNVRIFEEYLETIRYPSD